MKNFFFSTAITDNGQPLFVAYGLTHKTTGDLAPNSKLRIQIPAGKYTVNNGNYNITYPSYVLPVAGTELTGMY